MQSIAADGFVRAGGLAARKGRFFAGAVLPRPLRRPARALQKLDVSLPRYLGLKGLAALFAMTALAGTIIGGHATSVVSTTTAWAGLAIDQVKISGQSETAELDVLDRLALGKQPSLVTFDVEAARARVETLPWVEKATIRKLYPDFLEVAIEERAPFAIWQSDGENWLIDDAGKLITDKVDGRYTRLPLVTGVGAADRAREFTRLVGGFPAIAKRVHAGVLIDERRWTVVLDNGIEIMLPEADPVSALATVARLDADKALLSRAIAAVDLRTPGEMVLRLDSDGLAAHQALVKARAKAAKARS